MGVEREDFIVIGANIGWEQYDDDKYDEYEDYERCKKEGEITYIVDGMGGRYFIVGEIVRYGDEYNGFGTHELSFNEETAERVTGFVRDKFGITVTPTLMVVTHYY